MKPQGLLKGPEGETCRLPRRSTCTADVHTRQTLHFRCRHRHATADRSASQFLPRHGKSAASHPPSQPFWFLSDSRPRLHEASKHSVLCLCFSCILASDCWRLRQCASVPTTRERVTVHFRGRAVGVANCCHPVSRPTEQMRSFSHMSTRRRDGLARHA